MKNISKDKKNKKSFVENKMKNYKLIYFENTWNIIIII